MDTESLEKIGLTRNETIVYTTLLKTGTTKTGQLLKESKLNSGKIYEILESLKAKGLVSETIKDNVKNFTGAPPQQLRNYLDQKKQEIDEEEKQIDKIIPELEILSKTKAQDKKIVTYSGFRGIITAAEEALENTKENEEIISLGISDVNYSTQNYWNKWEQMREKKKITARYILSQKGKTYAAIHKLKNLKIKIMELNTPVGIDVYSDKIVLLLHYTEPMSCTLIYDEATATTFRSYFEVLWKTAKA